MKSSLQQIAATIVQEFNAAEKRMYEPFPETFRNPMQPNKIIDNHVGVRVKLLRQLAAAAVLEFEKENENA